MAHIQHYDSPSHYYVVISIDELTNKLGSAFINSRGAIRDRLWKRVQEHAEPAPKGMKRPATQWVKPGIIARVKHLRGEEDLRHASLQDFGRNIVPIQRKASDAGIFDGSELALLGRVFDKLGLDEQSDGEREMIASRIIANYMAGIKDECELVSMSRQPLGR